MRLPALLFHLVAAVCPLALSAEIISLDFNGFTWTHKAVVAASMAEDGSIGVTGTGKLGSPFCANSYVVWLDVMMADNPAPLEISLNYDPFLSDEDLIARATVLPAEGSFSLSTGKSRPVKKSLPKSAQGGWKQFQLINLKDKVILKQGQASLTLPVQYRETNPSYLVLKSECSDDSGDCPPPKIRNVKIEEKERCRYDDEADIAALRDDPVTQPAVASGMKDSPNKKRSWFGR